MSSNPSNNTSPGKGQLYRACRLSADTTFLVLLEVKCRWLSALALPLHNHCVNAIGNSWGATCLLQQLLHQQTCPGSQLPWKRHAWNHFRHKGQGANSTRGSQSPTASAAASHFPTETRAKVLPIDRSNSEPFASLKLQRLWECQGPAGHPEDWSRRQENRPHHQASRKVTHLAAQESLLLLLLLSRSSEQRWGSPAGGRTTARWQQAHESQPYYEIQTLSSALAAHCTRGRILILRFSSSRLEDLSTTSGAPPPPFS